jgi:membrane-associated protease RseP (regulator of RpoE activity)
VGSAAGLGDVVTTSATAAAVKAALRPSPYGPSDHARFYRAGVPVLFFHTGTHEDYHRPSDTADKLDLAGMARIAAVGAQVVERLAAERALTYLAVAPPSTRSRQGGIHGFLGVQGDGGGDGARLAGIVPGAAADRAGLREGDVLIRLGSVPLASFDELRGALRERRAGERVDVVFVRHGERRSVTATLDAVP